ncbi:hypothetical protein FNB79_16775 [Formosa sediminum]|uniref:Riboflavin synthase subunit beta n=1 Tax=Formosa sediminum TaxID=2594004 RepID=A0A516GVJ7_9FLAO|nr:hypothetical protein [Formosa sediminum]QDO95553.1 hypothetical protein FNB79_16775 [Formosa sediminum]
MNLFNQRKNKSFNYRPKFQQENKTASDEISSQWEALKQTRKHQGKHGMRLTGWLVIFILVIILWYVLSNYEL